MKNESGTIRRKLLFCAVAVLIGAAVAGELQLWRERQLGQLLEADLPPCEDPRPKLPDAAPVAGLGARLLAFSSKCEWIVVGNSSGSVQIIDRKNGRVRAQASAHPISIEALELTPDDKYLFTAAMVGGDFALWAAPTLAPIARTKTGEPGGLRLAFDAVNNILVTGGARGILGWKADFSPASEFAEPLFSAQSSGTITSLALSRDMKFIAAGATGALNLWGYDGPTARVIEVAAVQPYERREWITGVAFSKDGRVLVSVTRPPKKEVAVWELPGLERLKGAAGEPLWRISREPWKLVVGPSKDYAGPDREQLRFELHESGLQNFYAAWRGKYPMNPAAFRGRVLALASGRRLNFYDAFAEGDRKGPILRVPRERRQPKVEKEEDVED